jgi:predicted O-methyltransferase YrrM
MSKVLKSVAKSVIQMLPARMAAHLEYRSGRHVYYYPWGSAMNGQTARLEICRRAITGAGIDVILETGTYRGVTTEWFSGFGIDVYSIEIDEKCHLFSKMRLEKNTNVHLVQGDSKSAIGEKLSNKLRDRNVFAYLDAHWREHLPLREEVSDLSALTETFIIIIDDFKVPNDPSYEYDDYGANGSCTLEFLSSSISSDMRVYFPTTLAKHETGRKRGYCILAKGADNIAFLDKMDLLQASTDGQSEQC